MKHLYYIIGILFACCTLASCQDGDWEEPSFSEGSPYGNNSITDEGIITIKELIARYPNVFASTDQNKEITEPIKIKGRVTGNDLGGNIYKQFALQDETAAIIVAVNQNGLNGYLAEGMEIIIDLQGLHIGGYRKQPEIGQPYNGTSIGRMSKDVWQKHFKVVGGIDNIRPEAIPAQDFSKLVNDMNANCGKLVYLDNVHFASADGKKSFIDGQQSGGNYFSQSLKEYGSNVIIRTSSYADFASNPMPTGACRITGIATRFNNTWQIMMRKTSDCK